MIQKPSREIQKKINLRYQILLKTTPENIISWKLKNELFQPEQMGLILNEMEKWKQPKNWIYSIKMKLIHKNATQLFADISYSLALKNQLWETI